MKNRFAFIMLFIMTSPVSKAGLFSKVNWFKETPATSESPSNPEKDSEEGMAEGEENILSMPETNTENEVEDETNIDNKEKIENTIEEKEIENATENTIEEIEKPNEYKMPLAAWDKKPEHSIFGLVLELKDTDETYYVPLETTAAGLSELKKILGNKPCRMGYYYAHTVDDLGGNVYADLKNFREELILRLLGFLQSHRELLKPNARRTGKVKEATIKTKDGLWGINLDYAEDLFSQVLAEEKYQKLWIDNTPLDNPTPETVHSTLAKLSKTPEKEISFNVEVTTSDGENHRIYLFEDLKKILEKKISTATIGSNNFFASLSYPEKKDIDQILTFLENADIPGAQLSPFAIKLELNNGDIYQTRLNNFMDLFNNIIPLKGSPTKRVKHFRIYNESQDTKKIRISLSTACEKDFKEIQEILNGIVANLHPVKDTARVTLAMHKSFDPDSLLFKAPSELLYKPEIKKSLEKIKNLIHSQEKIENIYIEVQTKDFAVQGTLPPKNFVDQAQQAVKLVKDFQSNANSRGLWPWLSTGKVSGLFRIVQRDGPETPYYNSVWEALEAFKKEIK